MNNFSQNNHALCSNLSNQVNAGFDNPVYSNIYLTKREIKIILLLMAGNTLTEIALKLNLSNRTIEFYIKNIKVKLNN